MSRPGRNVLQRDVRTFLRQIKEKELVKKQLFEKEGALSEFLGRQKSADKDIKNEIHRTVDVPKTRVPFRNYIRLREPPARVRAKQKRLQQRRARPIGDEARKRLRIQRLLKN